VCAVVGCLACCLVELNLEETIPGVKMAPDGEKRLGNLRTVALGASLVHTAVVEPLVVQRSYSRFLRMAVEGPSKHLLVPLGTSSRNDLVGSKVKVRYFDGESADCEYMVTIVDRSRFLDATQSSRLQRSLHGFEVET